MRPRPTLFAVALSTLAVAVGCAPIPPRQEPPEEPVAAADTDPLWTLLSQGPPLEPGEEMPEVSAVDLQGRTFALADLAGGVVVLTLFETRSPDDTLCTAALRRLDELRTQLAPDVRERVVLLGLSVDPVHDTPAVMALHARRLELGDPPWRLGAVREVDVPILAATLGTGTWHRDDGSVAHGLTTAVIDARGRLAARFDGLSPWTVGDLLAAVSEAVGRDGSPRPQP